MQVSYNKYLQICTCIIIVYEMCWTDSKFLDAGALIVMKYFPLKIYGLSSKCM
jgi:hypothetical protein